MYGKALDERAAFFVYNKRVVLIILTSASSVNGTDSAPLIVFE